MKARSFRNVARRCREWWTRRRIIIAASVLAVIVLPPAGFATVLLISYAGHIADHAHTRGQDALWLGHSWVDGRRTSTDVDALAHRLSATGIRDVYVHIGPLNNDGTLDADRYPTASALLSGLAEARDNIVVQAWLGNVVGGDRLDLGSRATRQNVAQSARQALAAGFQGVHLDLEPIPTGSHDFLAGFGVAIYVDFAATERDWRDYLDGWVAPART